jgi:hypothetical protein
MLINEGGYGCIYYPGVCNTQGVSKVVNTYVAERELYMSSLIKKIPNYKDYFLPIVSSCKVQAKNIKRKCKALRKETSFVALQMPMIKTVPVKFDLPHFIELIPYISKLIKAKIVHFDLKESNILFTPKPYIIDFGISLDMKHVSPDYFFVYEPRQYQWPIEVHLLCYMMHSPLHKDSLERVCKEVYKHSPFLTNVNECISHYSFLMTCSKQEGVRRLIHGWKTWDMYAITCMLFLNDEIPELKANLHPNPKRRLTPRASRLAATSALTASTTSNG